MQTIEMTCVKISFKDQQILNIWCPYVPPEKPKLMEELCNHINDVIDKLKIAKIIARQNIEHHQEKNKENYDKKAKEPEFRVGQISFPNKRKNGEYSVDSVAGDIRNAIMIPGSSDFQIS
jgi:hypothetical protein